jgi:hypothetical protein
MHPRSLLRQLTRIPLEKPCDSSWESMVGTEKVRHCPSCDRDVYSLSDMTELEAELRLLNAADAVPCIRYARNLDGSVLHLAEPRRPYLSSPSARALVVASALGSGLVAGDAVAQQKDKAAEPVQCVMLSGLEPAAPAAPAAGAAAPAPAAAAPAPAAAPPPPPIPLAGAAPPLREQVVYGMLTVKSKQPRDIDVQGLKLKAPLGVFRMTPGNFVLKVEGKKKRSIKFTIKLNQTTTIDLDKA